MAIHVGFTLQPKDLGIIKNPIHKNSHIGDGLSLDLPQWPDFGLIALNMFEPFPVGGKRTSEQKLARHLLSLEIRDLFLP